MNYQVTRDIVSDLWPVVSSGEASHDSRDLVQRFLATDAAFADELQRSAAIGQAMPVVRLSPDAERRLIDQAGQRARIRLMIIGGAVALTGLIALIALGGVLLVVVGG